MSFGLCIVGCGSFAGAFARAMKPMLGEIDLYFASREPSRAVDYASRFGGIDSFGSYESAAADPRVDAMYICTPHHLHLAHVMLAAAAGKHVLVEKPIARTLDEAGAIIDAAERTGVNLMVAENYRFMPGIRLARQLIEDGSIGKLRMVQIQEEALFQPGGWRDDPELNGGGVFIDGGIHKADGLVFLAGRPETVFAAAVPPGNPGLEAEDGLAMITKSPSGVVGVINHTWTCAAPSPIWLSALGTGGSIYYEAGQSWLRLDDGRGPKQYDLEPDGFGQRPMVREFKNSVEEGRDPEMSGAAGMLDLEVVIAAYESVQTGNAVTLG